MYRIIDDRATGKSSRLMLLAKENNAIFVCANPLAMEDKARRYGIDGIRFVSYGSFFKHYEGQHVNVVIDELEGFIQATSCASNKLIGYTISDEKPLNQYL